MNKTSVVLIAAIASCGVFAKTIDLNGEWNFSKDGTPETVVRVPHDWAVDYPFDEQNSSGTAYLRGGIGWYDVKAMVEGQIAVTAEMMCARK